jgi:hypothetical protein
MIKRQRIYIAGPMNPRNGGGAIEYLNNCNRMIDAARKLIKLGFAPFCPAVDMLYYLGGPIDESPTPDEIKAYSLDWLPACEAMLLMPGWQESSGVLAEIDASDKLGPLPIFTEIEKLAAYFQGRA